MNGPPDNEFVCLQSLPPQPGARAIYHQASDHDWERKGHPDPNHYGRCGASRANGMPRPNWFLRVLGAYYSSESEQGRLDTPDISDPGRSHSV
jgi:hypothetical protein